MDSYVEHAKRIQLQPPGSDFGEKSVNDDGKERSHNTVAIAYKRTTTTTTIIVIIISSASIELDNQQPSAQKNKR